MLKNIESYKNKTYGFQFKGQHQYDVAGVHSLGKELQHAHTYYWDGLKRNEKDIIIFQYTLQGEGLIEVSGRKHLLKQGDAFFIHVPSEHKYYLPDNSSTWEFIYITLIGDIAFKIYNDITREVGHIISLNLYSPPIQSIISTIDLVSRKQLNDVYISSTTAYEFLMNLASEIKNMKLNNKYSPAITNALTFMENNYHDFISLDEIVQASGFSKYHFNRLFKKKMGITPIQYLTTLRINKSILFLRDPSLKIDEIAKSVGFSNANYFAKVFRNHLNYSPSEFRNRDSFNLVDYWISDLY